MLSKFLGLIEGAQVYNFHSQTIQIFSHKCIIHEKL